MSENEVFTGTSNLRNVKCCGARSKRTGQPCRQPKMRDKERCRIHGGKSTGPSKAGRRRISEARTIHGNYSKPTKLQRETNKTLSLAEKIGAIELEKAKALSPLLKKLVTKIDTNDALGILEYDFHEFIVFGQFEGVLKKDPELIQGLLNDYFTPFFGPEWYSHFLEVLGFIDEKIRLRVGVPKRHWKRLKPSQKLVEYENRVHLHNAESLTQNDRYQG